jgi:hypothetical protein
LCNVYKKCILTYSIGHHTELHAASGSCLAQFHKLVCGIYIMYFYLRGLLYSVSHLFIQLYYKLPECNLWSIMMTTELLYITWVQCLIYVLCHVLYLFLCASFVVIRLIWQFHHIKWIYDPKPSCGLFTPKTGYTFSS